MLSPYFKSLSQYAHDEIIDVNTSRVWKIGLLSLACILYALFLSPTPDHPGSIELVVLCLILLAIPAQVIPNSIDLSGKHPPHLLWARLALVFGISIPCITALLAGHFTSDIMRDLIGFAFLFLPLLFTPLIKDTKLFQKILYALCAIIGVVFGLRFCFNLSSSLGQQNLLYLETAPTILMSALFLSLLGCSAILNVQRLRDWKKMFMAAFFALIAIIPIIVMVLTTQRAGLGAYGITMTTFFLYAFMQHPNKIWRLLFPVVMASIIFWPALSDIGKLLSQKTSLVGLNQRQEEFAAIIEVISASPFTIFFGIGWGGTFSSPAVGGIEVNFTHSLLSNALLKTGVVGTALLSLYLITLVRAAVRAALQQFSIAPVVIFSALPPFLIACFLYANYKSFDFGLILLVLATIAASRTPHNKILQNST